MSKKKTAFVETYRASMPTRRPVSAAEQERQSRAAWVKHNRADLAKRIRKCDDYVTLKQVESAFLRGIARSVKRYFRDKDQA